MSCENLCFQAQEIGDDDLPTSEAVAPVASEDLPAPSETKGGPGPVDVPADEAEPVAQPELSWFDAAILGHLVIGILECCSLTFVGW